MPAGKPTTSFPELDPDKRLGELLLYIAKKCQGDAYFGNTKLNKILFFSDFFAYKRKGTSVTGSEYIKQDFGPTPLRLVQVRNRLEKNKSAVIQKVEMMGKTQHRLLALRDPDLSEFTADDIALVDQIIEFLRDKTAKEASDLSHNRIWRVAQLGETIPYEAVFVSDDNPTEGDVKRAQELIRLHGWAV